VKAVFDKWELDAAVIGETTEGKNLQIFMDGKCYADLTAEILTKKAPRYERETRSLWPMKNGAKAELISTSSTAFCKKGMQRV
jgi:phosphoribosylformylglycinamidine (FGAM) synthase-like enzyme